MALLPTSLPSSRCPPVKAQQCSYPLSYTSSIHPSMLPPLFNIALMFSWDFFAFTFCFLSTILPSSALIFSLPHLLFCSTSPLLPLFFGIPPQAPDFYPELKQPLPHLFLQHGTYLTLLSLYTSTLASLLQSYLNPFLSFPSYTSVADLLTFLLSITLPYSLDSSPAFSQPPFFPAPLFSHPIFFLPALTPAAEDVQTRNEMRMERGARTWCMCAQIGR